MPSTGGTKRSINAPCGKVFIGSLREANGKYHIHKRYCEVCQDSGYSPSKESHGNKNDMHNISISRHGNLIKQTSKEVKVFTQFDSVMVEVNDIANVEQAVNALHKI